MVIRIKEKFSAGMKLTVEAEGYILTLEKAELITMIGILQEGLELVRKKSSEGNRIAAMKLAEGKLLADELNRLIVNGT